METLTVFEQPYPVIKDLGYGWFLVAHPNGPAIARSRNWQYLGHLFRIDEQIDDCVPRGIRLAAVDALMTWAKEQPTYPKL